MKHDMSLDEIVNGKRCSTDEVMLYGFHDCAPRIMIKDGKYYGIPYRALLPKKVEGLLVAGRMITSEWDAHMSTRDDGILYGSGTGCRDCGSTLRKTGMSAKTA